MRVTRYIQVWITQGHEPQVAGIARTFQSLLPQPLFLSWMRCSLWAGKERNDSSLDLGPRAVTEIEKLGPSSLGHVYREGSIQSLWRPVLGGVPRASSTGSWGPGASLPAPGSVMAHWVLRVGHGGNVYTTEVRKYYIPCTLLLLRELIF